MRGLILWAVSVFVSVSCLRGQPTSVAVVGDSSRSGHFAAVSQHLELGGVFYAYVDVDGDVLSGGKLLTALMADAPATDPQAAMLRQDFAAIFTLLGLTDVTAIGGSSVADGGGFRNRTFFYTPKGRTGLLAMVGDTAKPFSNTRLAPADADLFMETELDVPVGYEALRKVVAKVGGDALVGQLEAQLKMTQPPGVSAYDVIQSLKGRFTLVLRVDPNDKIQLPDPKAPALPGISILIKADGLGKPLEKVLASQPMLPRIEEGGRAFYAAQRPLLPQSRLQPVIMVDATGALLISTSREFLVECLDRKSGLDQDATFKRVLASVGTEGNGLAYVTPRFAQEVRKIMDQVAAQVPEAGKTFRFFGPPDLKQPVISLRINRPDGILIKAHAPNSLKAEALGMKGGPLTGGLLAAMAIPAFQKVQMASEDKAIRNNLRMLHQAGQTYMIDREKTSARYEDLVGPTQEHYLKKLQPVAGEDYSEIVITAEDEAISVTTRKGRVITYQP